MLISADPQTGRRLNVRACWCSAWQRRDLGRRADGFLAQVLQRRSNHETFRILRVEANVRPDLVARFAITEIPTLLVLVDGEIRGRLSNPRGCSVISDLLAPWLR